MLAPQAQVKSTHKFIHIPFTVWVGFKWWLYSHAKTWSRFYTLVHSNHWSYLVVRNLRHNSHTKYFRDFVLWYKQHTLITIRAVDHWERRHVYLRGENIYLWSLSLGEHLLQRSSYSWQERGGRGLSVSCCYKVKDQTSTRPTSTNYLAVPLL